MGKQPDGAAFSLKPINTNEKRGGFGRIKTTQWQFLTWLSSANTGIAAAKKQPGHVLCP